MRPYPYTCKHAKANLELVESHDCPMIKTPHDAIMPVKNCPICARVKCLADLISVWGYKVLIKKLSYSFRDNTMARQQEERECVSEWCMELVFHMNQSASEPCFCKVLCGVILYVRTRYT